MLTFKQKTIYRREAVSRKMRKALVEAVTVHDVAAILELKDHPFTEGQMLLLHFPSTIHGRIAGITLRPGMTLYKDASGTFGALFPKN